MVRAKDVYKPRTVGKFKGLPQVKTPTSTTEFKTYSKQAKARFTKVTTSKNTAFVGEIKNSETYKDGQPGLFVQSIKGQKGKHLIQNALDSAMMKLGLQE